MKLVIVVCVLVMYFTRSVHDMTFEELFVGFPGDFISSTWDNMINEIKKPVRLRFGNIGKRKSSVQPKTTQYPTPSSNEPTTVEQISREGNVLVLPLTRTDKSSPHEQIEMVPGLKGLLASEFRFPSDWVTVSDERRVQLPYIPEPNRNFLVDWKQLKKPRFVQIDRGVINEARRRMTPEAEMKKHARPIIPIIQLQQPEWKSQWRNFLPT